MLGRNIVTLAAVVAGTAVWMTVLHIVLFPSQGWLGISGIGITAAFLTVLNRPWLHPVAERLPVYAVRRSLFAALILGTSFCLLFGAISA